MFNNVLTKVQCFHLQKVMKNFAPDLRRQDICKLLVSYNVKGNDYKLKGKNIIFILGMVI